MGSLQGLHWALLRYNLRTYDPEPLELESVLLAHRFKVPSLGLAMTCGKKGRYWGSVREACWAEPQEYDLRTCGNAVRLSLPDGIPLKCLQLVHLQEAWDSGVHGRLPKEPQDALHLATGGEIVALET